MFCLVLDFSISQLFNIFICTYLKLYCLRYENKATDCLSKCKCNWRIFSFQFNNFHRKFITIECNIQEAERKQFSLSYITMFTKIFHIFIQNIKTTFTRAIILIVLVAIIVVSHILNLHLHIESVFQKFSLIKQLRNHLRITCKLRFK